MNFTYKTLNPYIGAEISDFDDITRLTEETITDLKYLINKYHVVVIKGKRKWTENEQKQFTEQIGTIEDPIVYSIPASQIKQREGDFKIMNNSGIFWHSDNSYNQQPSYLSIFQMVDIPKSGTKTSFVSLINLYKNLSKTDKLSWRDYRIVYRGDVVHPLIWMHPFLGKRTVYFDISFSTDIVNHCENGAILPVKDSNKILNDINNKLSDEASLISHNWEEGDIVIIDNYAVAHRAETLLEDENRTLLRTTTEGIYF